MDLMTLAFTVLLGLGLLGADSVMQSGSVEVEVAIAPKIESISVDEQTLTSRFKDQLDEITSTASVVRSPEIRSQQEQGLGMSLAEVAKVQNVVFALQRQVGFKPDKIRFALFAEKNGALHGLVSGRSRHGGQFSRVMIPREGEQLMSFVGRCALWGGAQLAPYSTALYLLQQHVVDKDFTHVVALAEHSKALLPSTPVNADRALFNNLLGLVALFKNDLQFARKSFTDAMFDDPTNPVPFLNGAFAYLQLSDYHKAIELMEQLIRRAPPSNKVLLSTAYMTWGVGLLGLRDLPAADRMLAKATQTNPENSLAFALWADVKKLAGDQVAADRLGRVALETAASFENYSEVAALYFRLSWRDNEPLVRNEFSNPAVVTFH